MGIGFKNVSPLLVRPGSTVCGGDFLALRNFFRIESRKKTSILLSSPETDRGND